MRIFSVGAGFVVLGLDSAKMGFLGRKNLEGLPVNGRNSRSPSGMTTRKATATTKATTEWSVIGRAGL
jgi:hypothetical protein